MHTPAVKRRSAVRKLGCMQAAADLNWDDLRYFLAAAREGTLAGAARVLRVEHTTVGRRIAALERALGAALVLRRSDGLSLTRLGERFFPQAEQLERAISAMRELVVSEAVRVRLAVPSGFTHYFTAELTRLAREHPGLSLEILSGARQLDLSSGDADIAVRSGPVEDKELIARKLGEAGFSLYAAHSYLALHDAPERVDDLSGHQVIGFHESLASTSASRWLEARAAGAKVVLRSREMIDMLTAAVDGVGLALLPCSLGDAEARLVRLTDEVVASSPLWLVHRREARLSSELRVVVRFAVDVMKQNAALIRGERGPAASR